MRRGEYDEAELDASLMMPRVRLPDLRSPSFIGGIEVLSLFPQEINGFSHSQGFWGFIGNFNINTARFVIVGMFILTWLAALLVWHYGQIEQKWTATLQPGAPPDAHRAPATLALHPEAIRPELPGPAAPVERRAVQPPPSCTALTISRMIEISK